MHINILIKYQYINIIFFKMPNFVRRSPTSNSRSSSTSPSTYPTFKENNFFNKENNPLNNNYSKGNINFNEIHEKNISQFKNNNFSQSKNSAFNKI
jgi:hypothetical protein